ncbi:MAG: outer membrane beta-barrel protein [Chryseotalea sp. WA131a]|nr:MAG: outer membrane beta-barrel protein [Chryseotalea sp. WA131a]
MKSSENRKFEEAWKKAFADAEGNVSDSVWNNIDSQLVRAESGEMKKRIVFYKWLAAASVVFALGVGGVFVYRNSFEDKDGSRQSSFAQASEDKFEAGKGEEVDNGKLTIVKEQGEVGSRDALGEDADIYRQGRQSSIAAAKEDKLAVGSVEKIDKAQLAVDKNKVGKVGDPDALVQVIDIHRQNGQRMVGKGEAVENGKGMSKTDGEKKLGDEKFLTEQTTEASLAIVEEPLKEEAKSAEVKSMNELTGSSQTGVTAIIPTENILKETDTVAFIESPIKIAKVEELKSDEEKKVVKKVVEENWWAAVSGSAGSYDPNGGAASSSSLLRNAPAGTFSPSASQNNTASLGTAYSYGVNFGKRITPRWVLISGVGFLSQSINYPSNQAVFNASQAQAFSADASKLSNSNGTTAAPINSYELNSINEFITVPLQAGYLIVNKKIGVQLNAGVASDIFVRNSLVDPTSRLSTNTQTAGENSTYRTFNWTGLVGTELSYRISNHYRISVIPGMRYSFNSILKPTVGGTITPLIWDVGFRFRYIF